MKTYNEMYKLVLECYNEVMNDLMETFEQPEPTMPNTSEIIYDYKCVASEEWDDLTLEEVEETFDRIYKAIDAEATLRAQAWA